MIGTKILELKKSKYNGELKVVKSWGLGTYIQAGGLTQSGGIVSKIWKQVIKKISPVVPEMDKCLVLGLGGGSVAGTVSDYWPQSEIDGVDIDRQIVELGKKYLDLNNLNLKITIADANAFIKTKIKTGIFYNLIIVDLYKESAYPPEFSKKSFFESLRKLTKKGGLVVVNRLKNRNQKKENEKFLILLKNIFSDVQIFFPVSNEIFICKK